MKRALLILILVLLGCDKDEVEESFHDDVSFVPMLAGKSEDGNDV